MSYTQQDLDKIEAMEMQCFSKRQECMSLNARIHEAARGRYGVEVELEMRKAEFEGLSLELKLKDDLLERLLNDPDQKTYA